MANYTLTGPLGSGKSIIAVSKIKDYMLMGRKVATNIDIFVEHLMPLSSKQTITRLMDFPTFQELWTLGRASNSKNEESFGGMFLDELAVFLNSRDWQGKDREKVIKYLRHVRKQHWHTFFLTQDIESLDAQVRRALVEHKVTCKRTDRIAIPLLGGLLRLFGLKGKLPQVHLGIVRYGKSDSSPISEWWKYYGKGMHKAYNTDQIFSDEPYRDVDVPAYWVHRRPFNKPVLVQKDELETATFYQAGTYTLLSAWHIKGRYQPAMSRHRDKVKNVMIIFAFSYFAYLWYSHGKEITQSPAFKQVEYLPVKSYLIKGTKVYFTTERGHSLVANSYHTIDGSHRFKVANKWYKTEGSIQ